MMYRRSWWIVLLLVLIIFALIPGQRTSGLSRKDQKTEVHEQAIEENIPLPGHRTWRKTPAFADTSNQEGASISSYVIRSFVITIIVLLIALLIWILGLICLKSLKKGVKILSARFPELEARLSLYFRILKGIFHWAIIILLILFLLETWGIRIFRFLAHYSEYIYSFLRIPLILIFAVILVQISRFVISSLERGIGERMKSRAGASETEVNKQITTIGELCYKTCIITIWVVAAMMILKEFGFDIKPILAGAGIAGLAVGFGAQNLVRDVISGLFMIIENQVRVGDVAILNETGGLVEAINLRTTVLRGLDGALHVFPNGSINTLSNLTHNFSYYVFDIGVAYKEDVDRVCGILQSIGGEIMADPAYGTEILEPLEILGVDKFDDSAVLIKARIKTKPIKQWMVGREMNRRIKKRFDEEGIEIPFPHRTIYWGEASRPFGIRMEGNQETEAMVKQWVREVLAEGNRNG